MDAELENRLARIERLALLAAKQVFTVNDLALYLGRSPKTIYNKLDDLPHYTNGNQIFFRREEIEQWQCGTRHVPVTTIINQS